ncbi:MAG: SDR family NAD(P)-dependent oxidoreductase [Solirubrobacteraceae bacterium]
MDLATSTCLVTGANRGIGLAITQELAQRGATVVAAARAPDDIPPIEGAITPLRFDAADRASIEAAAAQAGAIDVLVNNAGVLQAGQLETEDVDHIYDVLQVNLAAGIHLSRLLLPGMLERGRGTIVCNASISGYAFFPGSSVYAASKAGLVAFCEGLRRELRGTGVNVLHLVTPAIDTRMMDEVVEGYRGNQDLSSMSRTSPEDWAAKVADAIEGDKAVLNPGGSERLAKLASRGPGLLLDLVTRGFDRR